MHTYSSSATRFPLPLLLTLASFAGAQTTTPGGTTVWSSRADFLDANCVACLPLPDLGGPLCPTTVGPLTFSYGPGATEMFIGDFWWVPDWLPGNALALSGAEDLDIDLSVPMTELGFDFGEPTLAGADVWVVLGADHESALTAG